MSRNRIKHLKVRRGANKRYYKNLKYPNIPLSEDDIYVVTTAEDRLDSLAHQFYNDVRLWWIIANANPDKIRRDGLLIKPGILIRIPSNIQLILNTFENLNTIE